MSEAIEIVGEDGETYYVTETADGNAAVWDATGEQLLGIFDEDGDELDVSEYAIIETGDGDDGEYEEADDGYDDSDGYDELEQRMQQLEQQAAQPREVQYVEDVDIDGATDDLAVQADYAEAALDRPFTLDEQKRIHREAMADAAAGRSVDIHEIADRLEDMGEGLLDVDSGHRGRDHEARTQLITQRLMDEERADAAERGEDDLDLEPPAQQDYYDMDDRSERQAYLADAMRGVADASDTYSSSDYPEE